MISMTEQNQPTHVEIQKLAYSLFENEGSPHGRSFEFWLRAKAILSQGNQSNAANKSKRTKETEPIQSN
jgi:hypothetical protein